MDKKLLDKFNRDILRETIRVVFRETELWKMMMKNNHGEEGMYDDIEINIRDFIETTPHFKKNLMSSIPAQFSILEYEHPGNLVMSLIFDLDLKDAMKEYDGRRLKKVDVDGAVEVTASFYSWKLKEITGMPWTNKQTSDELSTYQLWPKYEMPLRFDGLFGTVEESISNLEWKHLTTLLEARLALDDRQHNIASWNNIQKELWLKVCQEIKCDKNDVSKFIQFGKFFYNFVDKNLETPSVSQIIRNIK